MYLNTEYGVEMLLDQQWHCEITMVVSATLNLVSVLLIVSMTFERFYGIIRPHKAASFNTVKRAKIIIVCIVLISVLYNCPHAFITESQGRHCIPHAKIINNIYNQLYYWSAFVLTYVIPFVLLLSWNTVIIHTLRQRSTILNISGSEVQGQGSKIKHSDKQIYIMLLLVTFSFLILTGPVYCLILYAQFSDIRSGPMAYASYYLFFEVGYKLF